MTYVLRSVKGKPGFYSPTGKKVVRVSRAMKFATEEQARSLRSRNYAVVPT